MPGIIHFICWPMMFLSKVYFSIEGSSARVQNVAKIFPVSHFPDALRQIINDGATLSQVSSEITMLVIMSAVFLSIGSTLFSWTR